MQTLLMFVEIKHPGGGVRFSVSETDTLSFCDHVFYHI